MDRVNETVGRELHEFHHLRQSVHVISVSTSSTRGVSLPHCFPSHLPHQAEVALHGRQPGGL